MGMEGKGELNELNWVEKEMLCWDIKGLCRLIMESEMKEVDMCDRLLERD